MPYYVTRMRSARFQNITGRRDMGVRSAAVIDLEEDRVYFLCLKCLQGSVVLFLGARTAGTMPKGKSLITDCIFFRIPKVNKRTKQREEVTTRRRRAWVEAI